MTRIPYVRREDLGPEGRQLWDGIVNTWGDLAVTANGGLAGPFNALVTAPDAGRRVSALGATLRSAPSIGRGEDPPFEADDERAVYLVARQLGDAGRLDQGTYDAAHRLLGDAGMVELVSLCGYYTLISFLLNAFAVPLPPDALAMWAES
jgi:hypothetical protein